MRKIRSARCESKSGVRGAHWQFKQRSYDASAYGYLSGQSHLLGGPSQQPLGNGLTARQIARPGLPAQRCRLFTRGGCFVDRFTLTASASWIVPFPRFLFRALNLAFLEF